MGVVSDAVKQQPPSPPQSNDGDFGLGVVQQHLASLDQQPSPQLLRPAGLEEQLIVSDAPSLPNDLVTNLVKDPYGDPSQYQTAEHHVYYPSQPVSSKQ
jgi:hypothetical protein